MPPPHQTPPRRLPEAPPSQTPLPSTPSTNHQPQAHQPQAHQARAAAANAARQLRTTPRGLAQGSRRFRQAVWAPVAKLSGVLWLEFTGVFFGIFALSATIAAWKLRGDLHRTPTNADAQTHLFFAIAIAVVFAYFCSTSFLRASRRGRR